MIFPKRIQEYTIDKVLRSNGRVCWNRRYRYRGFNDPFSDNEMISILNFFQPSIPPQPALYSTIVGLGRAKLWRKLPCVVDTQLQNKCLLQTGLPCDREKNYQHSYYVTTPTCLSTLPPFSSSSAPSGLYSQPLLTIVIVDISNPPKKFFGNAYQTPNIPHVVSGTFESKPHSRPYYQIIYLDDHPIQAPHTISPFRPHVPLLV